MTKTFNPHELAPFTGSECVYRHALNRAVIYTEGAQYLAEHAGAYWLLDETALSARYEPAVAGEPFQVWKLTVRTDGTASSPVATAPTGRSSPRSSASRISRCRRSRSGRSRTNSATGTSRSRCRPNTDR